MGIKKLLCKLPWFEGVYINFCSKSEYMFRLIRYTKEGETYIKFSGHKQYLLEDGSTRGYWSFVNWSVNPISPDLGSRGFLTFFAPKTTKLPAKNIENIVPRNPGTYSWK